MIYSLEYFFSISGALQLSKSYKCIWWGAPPPLSNCLSHLHYMRKSYFTNYVFAQHYSKSREIDDQYQSSLTRLIDIAVVDSSFLTPRVKHCSTHLLKLLTDRMRILTRDVDVIGNRLIRLSLISQSQNFFCFGR